MLEDKCEKKQEKRKKTKSPLILSLLSHNFTIPFIHYPSLKKHSIHKITKMIWNEERSIAVIFIEKKKCKTGL
jgi:hypothetical protein